MSFSEQKISNGWKTVEKWEVNNRAWVGRNWNASASKLTVSYFSELLSIRSSWDSFAEIDHLYRGFRKDCPQGSIKKAEFVKIFANIFPNGEPEDFAQIVFNAYDRDRNGSIDFEEFICAMSLSRCSFEEWVLFLDFLQFNCSKTRSREN